MKLHLAALALMGASLFALPASAQPTFKVERLAEGVWAARPEQGANVGWFVNGDSVVVVDSGADAAAAKVILEKIAETAGKPVRHLIVTHAHGDHAGGVPTFAAAGVQIICHENAAAALLYLLQSDKKPVSPAVVAISERLSFVGGPRRAAIYWLGAGHTRGDLLLLLPEEKILFTGDLVLNGRLPYLQSPDVEPRGWEQILPRLAALDLDKIVPGHGEIGPRQGLGDTLAYVRKVNELATQFIQTRIPEELHQMKLREPENRIPNVPVNEDHIANVRAVIRFEKDRLEKTTLTPTPTPTRKPTGKKG